MAFTHLLWEGRRWIEVALFFFVIGVLLGLTVARTQPDQVMDALRPAFAQLGGLGQQVTAADSPFARAWIIFQRNAQVTLVMAALALPLIGMVPVLFMLVNGLLLGVVVGLSGRLAPGMGNPWNIFLALAPHGIVELPALFIAAGFSMRLGIEWLLPGASGARLETLRRVAIQTGAVLGAVLVLLALAAFIEGNVTLALVQAGRNAAGSAVSGLETAILTRSF